MYKRIALVLALVMMFVMVTWAIYAQDKQETKDKAATCTMNKEGKCPNKTADCCKKDTACKENAGAQCQKQQEAKKSACKESSCKSSCPAQAACKAAEESKK